MAAFCVVLAWFAILSLPDAVELKRTLRDAKTSSSRFQQPEIKVHPAADDKEVELSDGVKTYWVGQTARIVSGNTLILHCDATGEPVPRYIWKSPSGKIKTAYTAGNGTLTIPLVKVSHSGVWTCRAQNRKGFDEKSSVIKVYEPVLGQCAPPMATSRTPSSITLQLSCPTGNLSDPYNCHISSYRLKYRAAGTKLREKAITMLISERGSSSVTIKRLDHFTAYEFRVQGVYSPMYCHKDRAKFSNPATVQTRPLRLGPPTNATVVTLTNVSAAVAWNAPDQFIGREVKFRVYFKRVLGKEIRLEVEQKNHVNLTGLQPFTRYRVYVKAFIYDKDLQGRVTKYQNVTSFIRFRTLKGVPSPPVNASHHSVRSKSAVITWGHSVIPHGQLSYYEVHYASDNRQTCYTSKSKVVRVSGSTKGNLFDLKPSTSYCVWVTAVNIRLTDRKHLISNSSNVITFMTLATEILPPRSVTVSKIKARSVIVKWLSPAQVGSGHFSYHLRVYRFGGDVVRNSGLWSDGILVQTMNKSESLRHQTIGNLRPFTRYVVAVQTLGGSEMGNAQKMSKPSNVSFRTGDEKPTIPSNCSLQATSSTSFRIQFLPPYPGDYRVVFYKLAVRSHIATILTRRLPSHRRSVDIEQLGKGEYNVTLSAVTNNSRVLESAQCILHGRTGGSQNATALARTSIPPTVNVQWSDSGSSVTSVITIANVGTTWVHLSWVQAEESATSVMYYRVLLKEIHASVDGFPNVGSDGGNVYIVRDQRTWLTVTGLKAYKEYSVHLSSVRIDPITGRGVEKSRGTASFTTAEDEPSAPATLVVIPHPPSRLEVLWTAPHQLNGLIRGYQLNCSATNSTFTMSLIVGPDTYRYSIAALTSNVVYSVQVAAISIRPGPSQTVTQALRLSSPSPPRQLKSVMRTSSAATLTWLPPVSPNGNISHYNIYYKVDRLDEAYSSHSVPFGDIQNSVVYELTGLQSLVVYTIAITASNNAEQPESGPSNMIRIKTQSELREDETLSSFLTSSGVLAVVISETCLLAVAGVALVCCGWWSYQKRKDTHSLNKTSQTLPHASSTRDVESYPEDTRTHMSTAHSVHIYESMADLTASPGSTNNHGYENAVRSSVGDSLVTDVTSLGDFQPQEEPNGRVVPGYEPISTFIVSQ